MNPVVDYINAIEEGPRKELFLQMRDVIINNLPNGF
jgi:hypothetical protein